MKTGHRTILFVEDEPLLGELMTEALTDQGFDVEVAPSASHALRYLLSGAEVDVLFTDIDLGEGMDGATLAQLARVMRPQLPVVYASGRRSADQLDTVPGSVFLPKPYSLSQVDATINGLFLAETQPRR
jgi:two-component system cell cycle sensor histidine kinase/response regulator CckA